MPHHEHDCERCEFIGSFRDGDGEQGIMDVYLACDASSYDYIVRFGELGDYITVGVHSPYYGISKALHMQHKHSGVL